MTLLGFKKTTVGGKTFTLSDDGVTYEPKQLGLDGFAGGSIKKFRKTKYGIYLCLSKRDDILFLGYTENSLTDEGKKLLGMPVDSEPLPEPEKEPEKEPETDISQLKRKELIALAKKMEIEGKVATMKSVDLIAAIHEKREEYAAQKGEE
jgi:hypothetical protein